MPAPHWTLHRAPSPAAPRQQRPFSEKHAGSGERPAPHAVSWLPIMEPGRAEHNGTGDGGTGTVARARRPRSGGSKSLARNSPARRRPGPHGGSALWRRCYSADGAREISALARARIRAGFRALCSGMPRTPPGPEGSNGSGLCRVPRNHPGPFSIFPSRNGPGSPLPAGVSWPGRGFITRSIARHITRHIALGRSVCHNG